MDSGRKTIRGVVSDLDNFFFRLEFGDGADGAEDLFLHNLHVFGDVGEDGRLDEISFVAVAFTTCYNGGTSIFAILDVAHNAIVLELGDLGTLEGLWVEWVTEFVSFSTGLEAFNEFVVDAILNVDSGASAAALSVVEEDSEVDPGDGILDIGIVEDDIRGLTAKLESYFLQVGSGSCFHDLTSDNGRSCEGNFIDIHVCRESSTSDLSVTRNNIDDSWWEASFLDEAGSNEGREGSLFSALEDHCVAGSNGRANLPRPH